MTGKTLLITKRPGRTSMDLVGSVRAIANEEALSGVVRLDLDGGKVAEVAFGQSHRGLGIEMTTSAQLAIASGNKGFTALVVMSLIEQGDLSLDTRVRSILGDDLLLVDDRVTVEGVRRGSARDPESQRSNLARRRARRGCGQHVHPQAVPERVSRSGSGTRFRPDRGPHRRSTRKERFWYSPC